MKKIEIIISVCVLALILFFPGRQISWTSVLHFAIFAVIVSLFGVAFRFFQASPHISLDDLMDALGIEKEKHRYWFLNGLFLYLCALGLLFGAVFWYFGITGVK